MVERKLVFKSPSLLSCLTLDSDLSSSLSLGFLICNLVVIIISTLQDPGRAKEGYIWKVVAQVPVTE